MKDVTKMTFSQWLKHIRTSGKDRKKQFEFAKAVGISVEQLQSIERGERLPTKQEVNTICDALHNEDLSEDLRAKGLAEVEYKRTHPDVKLLLSDRTICWNCGKMMWSAYGTVNESVLSPDEFNKSMCDIATSKGVILQRRYSQTTHETHLVNVCPHCNAFIGEFFLHDLWYGETETIQIDDVADFIANDD
ncbi:MAG: helix-turn-helix domain-containing protein [Clostridia bacterium]|nr:helix-turn-helix domain-containing protein [Clostridia bacterium]